MKSKDNIVNLSEKLIAIRSISGNEKGLSEALELVVSQLQDFTIERFERKGIKSVLVYKSQKRPKKFRVILNGHLDVVPGKESQYVPKIKGNKLFGVGSMDMKANVACLVNVFKGVADRVNYPLGLQLVTDEEVGGFDGTKYQVDKGVRADFVVAGEPTNFDIVNKAKGILLLRIYAQGKTAHGAYPWRGQNAIVMIMDFLKELEAKYPTPKEDKWVTTVNVANIGTDNKALNKIPDDCFVELGVRYIPEDSNKILTDIKKLLPKGFKLEVIAKEPALLTDKNDKYIEALKNISSKILKKKVILRGANGSSDARHYASMGCSGIEFGPVGGDIGGDKAYVDIPSLDKYCSILEKFLLSLGQ
ncbi:MAG: M20/M25/M40 family metallo-hydrolase [bacterium]